MTKAFENTERDRLLWRSRAWEAEEQNRELRAWKESAMTELARWYAVWEALGQPGALGEIRAVAALAEVKRLRSAVPVVDDATRQEVEARMDWLNRASRAIRLEVPEAVADDVAAGMQDARRLASRLPREERVSDETYEIRWTVDYSARLTRERIAEVAISPDGVTDEYREACREWLAANPKGLTRDEFDALPDGTIIASQRGHQYVIAGGRGYYTTNDRDHQTVRWIGIDDRDLETMTVVEVPR